MASIKKSVVDLFTGTGGFSLALEKYSFETIFANDMIESSKEIYILNNPSTKFVLKDIHDINPIDIPHHDLLCGGFPCQPFSIAGKRDGFKDVRANVFWKILEIIEYHNPDTIILENVKNLKTHDNGNTYKTIEENLQNLGYHVMSKILDTSKITSLPHHRERIYIVCFKDKSKFDKFNLDFPTIPNNKIVDYLEDKIPSKYYYTEKLKVYETVKSSVIEHINKNILYQYRRHYVRENKSNCCPKLTANMGGGGHNVPLLLDNVGIRKLTPRECFNLQGFPIDYKLPKLSDSALYALAGNAISVPVVELIASRLNNL